MADDKLAAEEARRLGQRDAVRGFVEREVGAEIAAEATVPDSADIRREERVASGMRKRALDEVVATEVAVDRARGAARVSQLVDYAFYVIYALLGVRIALALMAGNPEAPFYRFIRAVTAPLAAPFRGIVSSPTDPDGHTLALPLVVAVVAYVLLHFAINGALRVRAERKVEL